MTEAAFLAAPTESAPIDFSRRFIAEEFTPLFHTPEYRNLTAAAQLRYNQLHALYFNEQVAFFEKEMLSPALRALMRTALPSKLAQGLHIFQDEERRHTAMFHALNRRCAPELYGHSEHYFLRVAMPLRRLVGWVSRQPRLFPFLFWLALLQEERSLHYSKGCLAAAGELEPHFIATHRAHLADEVGHVGWDEELLDWLWPQMRRTARVINAALLNWLLGEFFLLPKRSGLRVAERLAQEFSQLDCAALRRGMSDLGSNTTYLRTLYSREVTPRAFSRFDALPEFALLAKTLPGYSPAYPL